MITSLISISRKLNQSLSPLTFSSPVSHTYLTTDYARTPHEQYLEHYGTGKKRVLFLGMNPGPFGMAQTGVPFGEVKAVKQWMNICTPVSRPLSEHPKRPILGFDCQKSEVSGQRLWGLFSEQYPNPEDFFKNHFVWNYCPLIWMSETGANITPEKIKAQEFKPVESACLQALCEIIQLIEPEFLVGVGGFAEQRLIQAARSISSSAVITKILHPSPASPAANRGWGKQATKQLAEAGIWEKIQ